MTAFEELARLKNKLADGSLPPEEPLFVLRARDLIAEKVVRVWIALAEAEGCPDEKLAEAKALAQKVRDWPVKQYPGLPETRVTIYRAATAEEQFAAERRSLQDEIRSANGNPCCPSCGTSGPCECL